MSAGKENKSNSIIFRYFANAALFATCRALFPFLLLLPYAGPIPPELLFNESRVSAAPRSMLRFYGRCGFARERKTVGTRGKGVIWIRAGEWLDLTSERAIDRSIDRNHRAS